MQVSTFDFPNLYTRIRHDNLLAVLNSIIKFAFRDGARDKICVLSNNAHWLKNNSNRIIVIP